MDETDDFDATRDVATAEDIGDDVTSAAAAGASAMSSDSNRVGGEDDDEGLAEEDRLRIEEEERELQQEAARAVEEDAAGPVADNSVRQFLLHKGPVYKLDVHPGDPTLVLSGSGDDTGALWHAVTCERLLTLGGHTDSVVDVAFNHDGSLAAAASLDGTVTVYATRDRPPQQGGVVEPDCKLDGPTEGIEWMQWHPRGNVVLAGSTDGSAWMWSIPAITPGTPVQGTVMQALYGHSGAITAGCFWNEGRSICTVSEDATLRVWSPKTGECLKTIQGYGFHDAAIVSVDVHPDRPVAVTGSADTTARISHLETGKVTTVMPHPEYVETVAFCGTATGLPFVATGCGDGKVRVFDAATGLVRNTFSHEPGYAIVRIEWALASPLLYSCSTDGTTAVWDFTRGEEPVLLCKGHSESVLDFRVSQAGGYIVTGSDDGKALIFEAPVYNAA